MKNRLKIAAALVAAAFAVTACSGGGSTGSGSGAGSDAEIVAWVDKVCGVGKGAADSLSEPNIDVSDMAKAKEGFSKWLGDGSAAMDKALKDLDALKNGPHPDSEKVVKEQSEILGKIKTAFDDGKKSIDAADPNDPAAYAEALSKVAGQMTDFAQAAQDFEGTLVKSNLAEAEKKAKNCQDEQSDGSSSSAPTS